MGKHNTTIELERDIIFNDERNRRLWSKCDRLLNSVRLAILDTVERVTPRYLEMKGELRKAIGVLKKRMSDFEKTLREFEITRYGIKVGKPLTELRGILKGSPEWISHKGEE